MRWSRRKRRLFAYFVARCFVDCTSERKWQGKDHEAFSKAQQSTQFQKVYECCRKILQQEWVVVFSIFQPYLDAFWIAMGKTKHKSFCERENAQVDPQSGEPNHFPSEPKQISFRTVRNFGEFHCVNVDFGVIVWPERRVDRNISWTRLGVSPCLHKQSKEGDRQRDEYRSARSTRDRKATKRPSRNFVAVHCAFWILRHRNWSLTRVCPELIVFVKGVWFLKTAWQERSWSESKLKTLPSITLVSICNVTAKTIFWPCWNWFRNWTFRNPPVARCTMTDVQAVLTTVVA